MDHAEEDVAGPRPEQGRVDGRDHRTGPSGAAAEGGHTSSGTRPAVPVGLPAFAVGGGLGHGGADGHPGYAEQRLRRFGGPDHRSHLLRSPAGRGVAADHGGARRRDCPRRSSASPRDPPSPSSRPFLSPRPSRNLIRPPYRVPPPSRPGTRGGWTLHLTHTGQNPIHLELGPCDLKFEVWNAAGAVARPATTPTICTDRLLSLYWNGRDPGGDVLPAGTYTLHALFRNRGMTVHPPQVQVTLR